MITGFARNGNAGFSLRYFDNANIAAARKRFTTEQIIGLLRKAEVRLSQGHAIGSRGIGVSPQSYYRWRREYGDLKPDQAMRFKDLECENERLKKGVPELTLDKLMLKEALPVSGRALSTSAHARMSLSVAPPTQRRHLKTSDDDAALTALGFGQPRRRPMTAGF